MNKKDIIQPQSNNSNQSDAVGKGQESELDSQSYAYATGEICFILLPFMVMAITFAYKGNLVEILKVPEWSLASSVMFGQSIIKIIHSIGANSSSRRRFLHYRVGTILALIILFGLVPSLTMLSLIYTDEVQPIWLLIFQLIIFIASSIIFSIVNIIQIKVEEENKNFA